MALDQKRVLVIAAHPDDELLGCGGTVARHVQAGDKVTSVIVCEGESLRYGPNGVGQRSHIQSAARRLGVEDVRLLGFPDQRLDTINLTEVIGCIEPIVREVRPQVVYGQYGGDVNRDHYLVFQALLVATRPTEDFIELIYAFDTASSTEWAYPRTFVEGAPIPSAQLGCPGVPRGSRGVHDGPASGPPWERGLGLKEVRILIGELGDIAGNAIQLLPEAAVGACIPGEIPGEDQIAR